MTDTITKTRHSSSVKTLLVENDAATLPVSNAYIEVISPFDCTTYDRMTLQFRNADSDAQTAQVWGSLHTAPSALGATAVPASSYWVQIGDDITVAATSSALKSISTTGLRKLSVRIKTAGSGTYALAAGNVLVHCQGTI
jgi:hypothetical protein|tara:strand:+ start:63 stop:482 length:420 start_codon:yes stop_codon:yes gene_type:complete